MKGVWNKAIGTAVIFDKLLNNYSPSIFVNMRVNWSGEFRIKSGVI